MKKKTFVLILSVLFIIGLTSFVFSSNETILPQVEGTGGMAAGGHPLASLAATEVLLRGGNAIDAAVAAAFVLPVAEPGMSGLGGGGFMVIYHSETDEIIALDYREIAPSKAEPDMFIDENEELKKIETDEPMSPGQLNINFTGHLCVGVPGMVAGTMYALDNYGSMPRSEVLAPAIRWAEDGVLVTRDTASDLEHNYPRLMHFEGSKEVYIKEDGSTYQEGDLLIQRDLGETIRLIAQKGNDGFYRGPVAEAIARDMAEHGGLITLEDLENYPQVRPRVLEPAIGTYRDYTIASMPPPSSGGAHIIQMLNILEHFDISSYGHNTTQTLHLLSEVGKIAFADRAAYMGDPDFVDVPLEGLTSKEYAEKLVERIAMDSISDFPIPGDPFEFQAADKTTPMGFAQHWESPNTTHFSVVDAHGNMVAMTHTNMASFGSGIVVPGTGVVLNNQPQNFTAIPGHANSVAPGKTPLSSMSPTIVIDPDGRPLFTLGCPGGTGIFGAVKQVIMNIIDHDMDLQEAIEQPRIRVIPRGLLLDTVSILIEGGIDASVVDDLKAMGYDNLDVFDTLARTFASPQAVYVDYDRGLLIGAADPRRSGRAIGY